MNRETVVLEKLLEKYRFTARVPDDVQAYALRARDDLIELLKIAGAYTFLAGLVIRSFFFLKKLGISATFSAIKIALTIGAAGLVTMSATGGYVALQRFAFTQEGAVKLQTTDTIPKTADQTSALLLKDGGMQKHAQSSVVLAGMSAFLGEELPAQRVEERLKKNLDRLLGPHAIIMIPHGAKSGVGKVITGSVRKTESGYYIMVKMIDVASSKILAVESANVDGEKIDEACDMLAEKLLPSIRK
jgi:hypothetical protein